MPPVDGFMGSLGGVCVKLATLGRFFRRLAQGLAFERETVRGVREAVEDSIGDGRIDDPFVPVNAALELTELAQPLLR